MSNSRIILAINCNICFVNRRAIRLTIRAIRYTAPRTISVTVCNGTQSISWLSQHKRIFLLIRREHLCLHGARLACYAIATPYSFRGKVILEESSRVDLTVSIGSQVGSIREEEKKNTEGPNIVILHFGKVCYFY